MKRLATLFVKCTGVLLLMFILIGPHSVMAKQGANTWWVPGDFSTIQKAIESDDVKDGDTLRVGPGIFEGAEVTKGVHIVGVGKTVIDSGPAGPLDLEYGFWLQEGSDGASISHITFAVGFGVYGKPDYDVTVDGKPANDVTVDHCRFINNFQAITNWGGSNWYIHHNTIVNVITVGDEGGIGGTPILIAGQEGAAVVRDNVVAHNSVTGEVLFDPDDDGSEGNIWAIGMAYVGAEAISGNLVTHNRVNLVSNRPDLRKVVAFVLADFTASSSPCDVIHDNVITKNDFRGPSIQFEVSPTDLWNCNLIYKNR